jgi:hypothetical protein
MNTITKPIQFYTESASVIYTDAEGRKIDTFVIFDTDPATGLTHINHKNLKVTADQLKLHSKTVCSFHMPLKDAFSFEILQKLKEKYVHHTPAKQKAASNIERQLMTVLSKAS